MASWIFFDMDGTLINSVPSLYRSYDLFLRTHGLRGSQEEFDQLNGPSLMECVRILSARYALKGSLEQNIKVYYDIVKKEAESVNERPGAGAVLAYLKQEGHKLSLVTSATSDIANKILKKANWSRFFDTITCGEEVELGKPAPDIYQLALRKAGCRADEVLVVEDSHNGLKAARSAGLKAIDVESYFKTVTAVAAVWQGRSVSAKLVGSAPKQKQDHIFSVADFKADPKKAVFFGSFVNYRDFKQSLNATRGDERIQVLAVSGVAVVRSPKGHQFLVGRRSRHVGTYQGYWELVPSGGVDGYSVSARKKIDLEGTLLRELLEESGLSQKHLERVTALGVVLDHKVGAFDVGYTIHLKPSALKEGALRSNTKEYSRMVFCDERSLERLFKKEKKVAPTSLLFWDMYVSSRNKKGSL